MIDFLCMTKSKHSQKSKRKTVSRTGEQKRELFQTVRGMKDILPQDEFFWKKAFRSALTVAELHDFHYIETPVIESADLFRLGVGEGTDIVEKEMYVFKTKGGDEVALRPDGTAPVMRSYLEHHLGHFSMPLKVFYLEAIFRYERPQAGREREHHQLGFEIIGDSDPLYDAETLIVILDFLKAVGIKTPKIKINTIGCRVCRPNYRKALRRYYGLRRNKICSDCLLRMEKNPLRILDCKNPECVLIKEKAPVILDYICQNCNNHFSGFLEFIEDNEIFYEPDPFLVRGLDYYNKTVFEVFDASQKFAISGGGRYDYLSELLGGRFMPAVGGSVGLERVYLSLKDNSAYKPPRTVKKKAVFFVAVGEKAKKISLRLMRMLRDQNIPVEEALSKKSLTSQLKAADRSSAPFTLILGQKEIFERSLIVRDMKTGAQENIAWEKIGEIIKKKLK